MTAPLVGADCPAAGQEVRAGRFLVVGAGGLGGPIACALAAAGAEHIAVCDPDVVELSNLQRQVQFGTADIGRAKVDALTDELARRGYARMSAHRTRFDGDTAGALLASTGAGGDGGDGADVVDVVIDGSDDFATKFLVNDRAVAAGASVVIASALRWHGHVFARAAGPPGALHDSLHDRASLARAAGDRPGCYRCLFERPPRQDGQSCAEAGVVGAIVAVIGGVAAQLALSLARARRMPSPAEPGSPARAGEPPATAAPATAIYVFDDLADPAGLAPRVVRFGARPDCPTCGLAARSAPASTARGVASADHLDHSFDT